MPAYEYKCKACGTIKEETHSVKEDPFVICPYCMCGMTRQCSAVHFRFATVWVDPKTKEKTSARWNSRER